MILYLTNLTKVILPINLYTAADTPLPTDE